MDMHVFVVGHAVATKVERGTSVSFFFGGGGETHTYYGHTV